MTRRVTLSPPSAHGLDLDYRPATYWPEDNLRQGILTNILGEVRRRFLEDELACGSGDTPPAGLMAPVLEPELREDLGRLHPWFMGGEYLPDYHAGEVEIARVVLRSTTMDVAAVRACRCADGLIHYRVVDEYASEFIVVPAHSRLPLTTGEMIQLLDGAEPEGPGLVLGPLAGNLKCGADPEHLEGFVTVHSDFYPELEGYYEALCDALLSATVREEDDHGA